MRNVFQENNRLPQRDMIEKHQMLMNLAHVADMGNNRQPEFLREQSDRQEFTHARQARAVRLDEMNRAGFDEVLEHHPIRHMFTQRHSHR